MVCGTSSDAGKSTVVTGLCRLLARRGIAVAPFKGQNMSLNAMVTADGGEIGRAQWVQAMAAGARARGGHEPGVAQADRRALPRRSSSWAARSGSSMPVGTKRPSKPSSVSSTPRWSSLRSRFDVVVCEGAGSPAEINLLRHDLVNLGLAQRAGIPAVLVGDIERGGVFAHLFGTVGAPAGRAVLARAGLRDQPVPWGPCAARAVPMTELEDRCGVPTLGVLPHLGALELDAEDSLALSRPSGPPPPGSAGLDVAAIRLPRLSNFTDLDPLVAEPGVRVRWVDHAGRAGRRPDLVVVGGTRATVDDLRWLRETRPRGRPGPCGAPPRHP